MSNQNNVSMPQSSAGLQRFSQDDTGKVKLKPMHVIFLVIAVAVFVLILHFQGISFLN
jgi:preprotein translocase subunit Sec61beta